MRWIFGLEPTKEGQRNLFPFSSHTVSAIEFVVDIPQRIPPKLSNRRTLTSGGQTHKMVAQTKFYDGVITGPSLFRFLFSSRNSQQRFRLMDEFHIFVFVSPGTG